MPDNKQLSKSESYLKNLDMDRLVQGIQDNLECPRKVANAIGKLITAKIYLEIVCEEEDMQEYIENLEDELRIHHVQETLH
jgi:hypothetical protein